MTIYIIQNQTGVIVEVFYKSHNAEDYVSQNNSDEYNRLTIHPHNIADLLKETT